MIRKTKIEDLTQIIKIEESVFSNPWTIGHFQAEFEKNFSNFYVYELNDEVVGYIVVWDLGESMEIADFAFKKEIQGKGCAKFLLDYILKEHGYNKDCFLEVAENNFRAIGFYEKMGFKKIAVRKNYYGKNIDAIVMKLTKKEVSNAKSE